MIPLRVVDVHKTFHGRPILSGVEFELQPGDPFGVIGENGTMGYCPQKIVLIISHSAHDIERFDRLRTLRGGQLDDQAGNEPALIEEVAGA
jgi:ABC-type uncharacterized transport system ATPase subunit